MFAFAARRKTTFSGDEKTSHNCKFRYASEMFKNE